LALAENILKIDYTNSGKPFSGGMKISISHSGNWIGMMTSTRFETGIDIEFPHERIHKIKDRFLTEVEKNEICKDDTFLLTIAWGVKEAVFKKYGGPTVFFKEKINLCEINSVQNSVRVKCIMEQKIIDQALKFEILNDGYILVYTL
jgi:phosphopantetheinyl transferase